MCESNANTNIIFANSYSFLLHFEFFIFTSIYIKIQLCVRIVRVRGRAIEENTWTELERIQNEVLHHHQITMVIDERGSTSTSTNNCHWNLPFILCVSSKFSLHYICKRNIGAPKFGVPNRTRMCPRCTTLLSPLPTESWMLVDAGFVYIFKYFLF